MDEVLLELEPAVVGPHLGPDRLVGHRQDPRRRCPSDRLEPEAHLGQPAARAQPRGPRDVQREVAVAEREPVGLAVRGQLGHRRVGVALDAPAPLDLLDPGQVVEHRVVVGHDQQAVPLAVVAGVDDDRQPIAEVGDGGRRRAWRRRRRRPARRRATPSRVEELDELADPADGLEVVRRGHVDEQVPEPELEDRLEALGDLGRRPDEEVPVLVELLAVRPRAAPCSTPSPASCVSRMTMSSVVVRSISASSRPIAAQCSRRIASRSRELVDGAHRVPLVAVPGQRPERLLRPRPADHDRQPHLHRPRRAPARRASGRPARRA